MGSIIVNIIFDNVTKKYKSLTAIEDVSLEIGHGVYGLLGPNGAGKTTLMKMLVGLLPVSSGSISINGIKLDKKKNIESIRRNINYLPQEFSFYPSFTVKEILDYFMKLWGRNSKLERREFIKELLNVVGLQDQTHTKIKSLSGGMLQRVGIAVTLINDPSLLVVDEPTAGLDPEERIRFRNFLARLASSNRTVILSTHIAGDIESICSDIGILKYGKLVFNGKIKELINQTKGYVWQGEVGFEQYLGLNENYNITSNIVEGDQYKLRLIAEENPVPHFELVTPSLEEAYLTVMERGRG